MKEILKFIWSERVHVNAVVEGVLRGSPALAYAPDPTTAGPCVSSDTAQLWTAAEESRWSGHVPYS
jgi:hypothetical protein